MSSWAFQPLIIATQALDESLELLELSDSITVNEVFSYQSNFNRTFEEIFSITEGVQFAAGFNRTLSETSNISEVFSYELFGREYSEALNVSEDFSYNLIVYSSGKSGAFFKFMLG
jgi:hypothetical protein